MRFCFMVKALGTRNASGMGAANGVSASGMLFIVKDNWFNEVLLWAQKHKMMIRIRAITLVLAAKMKVMQDETNRMPVGENS